MLTSKTEPWKRALAIAGVIVMAPIAFLAFGILALTAIPGALVMLPVLAFKADDASGPPRPPLFRLHVVPQR